VRIAILSDIHGNLEAFKAVLSDMETSQVDEVMCLGDSIGYGPDPVEVLNLLREKNILSVMGNHEMAVSDPEDIASVVKKLINAGWPEIHALRLMQ
jgi:predicted phosphodiesterase